MVLVGMLLGCRDYVVCNMRRGVLYGGTLHKCIWRVNVAQDKLRCDVNWGAV